MLPIGGGPDAIRKGLRPYREVFRRAKGFAGVSRDVTGVSVSPNKRLQGSHAEQVGEAQKPTRRTRHEAVWEAGREAENLLPRPRARIAPEHQKLRREVLALGSCPKYGY